MAQAAGILENYSETEQESVRILWSGFAAFVERLNRQKALYAELMAYVSSRGSTDAIVHITDRALFVSALSTFGPALENGAATPDLEKLYDVALDRISGALIIANKGATLWCLAPRTQTPFLTRHIGVSVYMPGLGLETINVGLVGNVYEGRVACRCESACTPSFLFGSQRCNCCHQWDSFRELAASFNPTSTPQLTGQHFEEWVQSNLKYEDRKHLFKKAGPGFVFLHMDSQNGMGSGATSGEFSVDLFNRASLRHRGEYSAEQILKTTMAGGFTAIGLTPDPRSIDGNMGYKAFPVILEYLGVSRDLIFLSNNRAKLRELTNRGFKVKRVKSLGAVNGAGALEAEQRGTEFGHLDIDASHVSFVEEVARVKSELAALFRHRGAKAVCEEEIKCS